MPPRTTPPRTATRAPQQTTSAQHYLRRQRLRALVWRARPVFYLASVAILTGVIFSVFAPDPAVLTTTVVLTSPSGAGQVINASHVAETESAAAPSPDSLLSGAAAIGRRVLVDLPAGSVLTESVLSRPDSHQIIPKGKVAASIPAPPRDLLMMLEPGDLVDLMAAGEEGTQVLAERAQVLPGSAVGGKAEGSAGTSMLGGGSSGGNEPASLLVAVAPAESHAIAGLGVWADIRVVLVE